MPFMSYKINEENKYSDIENGMVEAQVCDVGTFQKPLLIRWRKINTCAALVLWSFNSCKKIIGYCYTLKVLTRSINSIQSLRMACRYENLKNIQVQCFFQLQLIRLVNPHQVDALHRQNKKNIWSLCTKHSCFSFHCEKDLDLLIEKKWRKRSEFATFISATEKLPSTKERKLALYQGNEFINMYINFL